MPHPLYIRVMLVSSILRGFESSASPKCVGEQMLEELLVCAACTILLQSGI